MAAALALAAYPIYRGLPSSVLWQRLVHVNGGQLSRLKRALTDREAGLLGITFIGDSITWGTGTGQGPNPNPRNGTLSDPRDVLKSESYVNNFKRDVQDRYMPGSAVKLSNWESSRSGESVVEYSLGEKRIRISNQGINGATTSSYLARNLASPDRKDSYALLPNDGFVFVQLGVNDRLESPNTPDTPEGLLSNLVSMVNKLKARSDVILMCSGPAIENPRFVYRFGMEEVRAAITEAARICQVDFIDNYAALDQLDLSSLLADGLHPNVAGHRVISSNIISAIEAS